MSNEAVQIIRDLVKGISAWKDEEGCVHWVFEFEDYRRALEFLERQENEKEGGE